MALLYIFQNDFQAQNWLQNEWNALCKELQRKSRLVHGDMILMWPKSGVEASGSLTHLYAAYMRQWSGSSLIRVTACCAFGAKPTYCQLDPVKFKSKYKTFRSRKCICKYRLQNCGHFVHGIWVNTPKREITKVKSARSIPVIVVFTEGDLEN